MSRIGLILTLVLILGFSSHASAQLKIVPKDKLMSVASPRLSRDSASLQFETRRIVAEPLSEDDAPVVYRYPFRNVSSSTLKIRALRSTCTCVAATCDRMEIAPGEMAEISVRYNPKGHPGMFERKVFVYTQEGQAPSAVLSLAVTVETGTDCSREYPVQMGNIRLRRETVAFASGIRSVEKIRFINLSGSPLELTCEEMFLPGYLGFQTRPISVAPGCEGEIVITYEPDGSETRKETKMILKGIGVPPSQSAISITIE